MFPLTLQGMQAEAGRALPPHISEWGPPLVLLARVHRYAASRSLRLALPICCCFQCQHHQIYKPSLRLHFVYGYSQSVHIHVHTGVHLTMCTPSLQRLSPDGW
jgi:hypothetical protein